MVFARLSSLTENWQKVKTIETIETRAVSKSRSGKSHSTENMRAYALHVPWHSWLSDFQKVLCNCFNGTKKCNRCLRARQLRIWEALNLPQSTSIHITCLACLALSTQWQLKKMKEHERRLRWLFVPSKSPPWAAQHGRLHQSNCYANDDQNQPVRAAAEHSEAARKKTIECKAPENCQRREDSSAILRQWYRCYTVIPCYIYWILLGSSMA